MRESWEGETTANNLRLIAEGRGEDVNSICASIGELVQ